MKSALLLVIKLRIVIEIELKQNIVVAALV
jgi:hypothetical protein